MESLSPSPALPLNSWLDSENDILRLIEKWLPPALFVVLVLYVFVICSKTRIRCSYHRRRTWSSTQPPPSRTVAAPSPPPAQEDDNAVFITCTYTVDKPKSPITREDNNDGGSDCSICLEDFKNGDECKIFDNCNHGFHKICIDEWLSRDKHCPLCRGFVRTTSRVTNLDLV